MYADDATVYANIEDSSSDSFETEFSDNLEALNNQFELNKLSLFIEKKL